LGRRAGAWCIDVLLGALLALIVSELVLGRAAWSTLAHLVLFKSLTGRAGSALSAVFGGGSGRGGVAADLRPLLAVAGVLLVVTALALGAAAYRVVTMAVWGRGLGKAALGLRVVVDAPGQPRPGWARSWRRWAAPQLPGLLPLPGTGLLAFLPALRDPRRRGLHDRFAGTVVVDVRRREPRRGRKDADRQ
jgi:uncharacterized RDD family membrane protein YckC